MFSNITNEINKISKGLGYDGTDPKNVTKAINTLTNTLAGEQVATAKKIAPAISELAPYISAGGDIDITYGKLIQIVKDANIQVDPNDSNKYICTPQNGTNSIMYCFNPWEIPNSHSEFGFVSNCDDICMSAIGANDYKKCDIYAGQFVQPTANGNIPIDRKPIFEYFHCGGNSMSLKFPFEGRLVQENGGSVVVSGPLSWVRCQASSYDIALNEDILLVLHS